MAEIVGGKLVYMPDEVGVIRKSRKKMADTFKYLEKKMGKERADLVRSWAISDYEKMVESAAEENVILTQFDREFLMLLCEEDSFEKLAHVLGADLEGRRECHKRDVQASIDRRDVLSGIMGLK